MASKKRATHEIEECTSEVSDAPPTKKQKFPALFTNVNDLKEFQKIYHTLKTIYINHPSNILQEIAEFSTGKIKTCDNKLCNNEVLILNEHLISEKSGFCQLCKPKLTQCWFQWEDRYDNVHQCDEYFVERNCECGGWIRWCSYHRSYCNECGDVCCTNSHGASWKYENWKCSMHHSVNCISCNKKMCEAKVSGSWCIGCGFVCGDCIESKCGCKRVYECDDDGDGWYEYCIKHKYCRNKHENHLGFCDCSKECKAKLCCCQNAESDNIYEDKVIYFKCLRCNESKKYNSNHFPTERRFVCDGGNWTLHPCKHGLCLDCKREDDAQKYNNVTGCDFCSGVECDHSDFR
eukprot:177314_1